MLPIPNFPEAELWALRNVPRERYGEDVGPELAETEIRLTPGAKELTTCPAVYWEGRGAHFIIIKLGADRFRGQFYYRLHQMFGTGIEQFDDIGDCALTLLQLQADHESERGAGD
jgi:hypothetical protein